MRFVGRKREDGKEQEEVEGEARQSCSSFPINVSSQPANSQQQ